MKTRLLIFALAAYCTVFFMQCTKDDMSKTFHAHFYTTKQTGKMFLFVDGVSKGGLVSSQDMPACGDVASDVANVPLLLELRSGTYQITGKDEQGNIVSNSTMSISANRKSVSGNLGGLKLVSNDDCISVGLSE